jgi:hypothetical protein
MRITTVSVRGLALGVAIAAASCHAADAVATASATVIAPVAINKSTDLSFGSFAAGAGGSVTVSTSGVRVAYNAILSAANSLPTAAQFEVSGDPAATFDISVVASTTLDDGAGHSMAMVTCSDLTGANTTSGNVAAGTLSAGGSQSLFVGGTLSVAAAQMPGFYSGSIAVTVEYN